MGRVVGVALLLVLLALTLGVIERRIGRAGPRRGRSARERGSDVLWWLFGAIVNEPLKQLALVVLVLVVGGCSSGSSCRSIARA